MSAYHSCLAVIAAAGSNVIAGTGFLEEAWLSGCLEKLPPFRVLFVQVIGPLEELEWRERKRGDKRADDARSLAERLHRYGRYSLIADTSKHSQLEYAALVNAALESQSNQ